MSSKIEASIHLSQWLEYDCGAKSWKESRLLRESMFIPVGKWTLILKNGRKWSFPYGTKASIRLSQWGEWISSTQSLKEERLLCESMLIPIKKWTLILKMADREVFLIKPKHHYYLSQWGECVYCAQSWKERRLLY